MLIEESILGTIMKEPHLLMDTDLKPEYFQYHENRNLLIAFRELQRKGLVIDMVTLITMTDHQSYGGAGKLNKIQNLANVDKFDSYVDILLERWREREKQNILEIAKQENWSIERITKALDDLTDNLVDDRSNIKELVLEVAEDPWKKREVPKGIQVGLNQLQNALSGLQKTDLIIVAARPSMGKTDFMLHLAKQAGWSGCIPIVFSLEMSAEKLRDRLIASTGNYNRFKMKNTYERLTEQQKAVWMQVIGRVSETNIEIFDKSGQTLSEIRMKIRKVKNENPGKDIVVFIDYLTLIKPMDDHKGNMHLAISDISKGLKGIAKEFNCPVVSLAQLSRSVEKRNDKRPILSDLRESGSIEEDADVVMFLYRDAYYTKDENDNSLEIIIAKNREGETGIIKAKYNKYTGAITDEFDVQRTAG